MIDVYPKVSKWCNENQGVLTIAIFIATAIFGWLSGIFSGLRKRPKFKISLIEGPTFCCTFPLNKIHKDFEVHRTCLSLYLAVANIGSAPASIEKVSVGYHWDIRPISLLWIKYSIGWFWLTDLTAALDDFQVKIGDSIKVYPFLFQRNALSPANPETYLGIGQSTMGIVYFEQPDSWGACFPNAHAERVQINVCITDTFGHRHSTKFTIPSVSIEEARKFNPAFGKTLAELRGEPIPIDAGT